MRFKLPFNKQGIVIDILLIAANLLLFPLFSAPIEALFRGAFNNDHAAFNTIGILMVVVLIGRLGGLYLKRFPLQARVRNSQSDFAAKFLFISVPVTVLAAVGVWVTVQYTLVNLGWLAADADGYPVETRTLTILMLITVIALTIAEALLLFRLGKSLKASEASQAAKGGLLYGRVAEWVADGGLFLYMFVWQVVYYGIAAWILRPYTGPQDIGAYAIKFVALALIFTQFYLSPRAVFLAEDRRYLSTWLFILGAFISSLLPHWLQQYTGLVFNCRTLPFRNT